MVLKIRIQWWFNFIRYSVPKLKSLWPLLSSRHMHITYGTALHIHTHTHTHTHFSWQPPWGLQTLLPYQQQIISAYCIVANGHTIPGLIGCLSDFVFVLLCPCLSINPHWLQSSQPGEWIRRESDNWLPRWGRSFISPGLPGLIETV